MLMFTVITVQLYHTPIALLEQLYPVGLFYFSSGVVCGARSELSLSKKSNYNDEMILLTNLIS